MKRRDFIKALVCFAVAPLALPAAAEEKPKSGVYPGPTFDHEAVRNWEKNITTVSHSPELRLDKSTIRKIEESLSGKNARPWNQKITWPAPVFLSSTMLNNPGVTDELHKCGLAINYKALHEFMFERGGFCV